MASTATGKAGVEHPGAAAPAAGGQSTAQDSAGAEPAAALERLAETHRLQTLELQRVSADLDRLRIALTAARAEVEAARSDSFGLAARLREVEAKREQEIATLKNERRDLRRRLEKQERALSKLSESRSYRLGRVLALAGSALIHPSRTARRLFRKPEQR